MSIPYVTAGTGAQIEGLDELVKKLNDMTTTARLRKVALKAIVSGAKVMRASIRTEAPVADKDTTGKYAHSRGALKAGVRYKASSVKNVQYWGGVPAIAAYIVGPFGKGTAQRHLVVSGHTITGHKPNKVQGGRTKANSFVLRGAEKARGEAMSAIESTAREAMEVLVNG